MTRIYLTSAFLSLSLLAGCVPSQQEYATIQETVRGSAKARKLAMSECTAHWTSLERKNASIVLDVSEKSAPTIACSRLVEAVRSGKLTYQDAVALKRGRATPKIIKILQGR